GAPLEQVPQGSSPMEFDDPVRRPPTRRTVLRFRSGSEVPGPWPDDGEYGGGGRILHPDLGATRAAGGWSADQVDPFRRVPRGRDLDADHPAEPVVPGRARLVAEAELDP